MSDECSLLDLAPAPLVFRDDARGGDGARYEWRMLADLGLEDLGALRRIQEELSRTQALLSKANPTADDLDRMAARMTEGLNAFLTLMLPALPHDRLQVFTLREKQYLIERWRAVQPQEESPPPLAVAAAPATPRGKRLPVSSPPTG